MAIHSTFNVSRQPILLLVFLTGAAVLAIEVAATRLLAPAFGTTVFAVSSVISVVLGALSLGYFLGGRWADAYASPRLFYWLIFGAGVSVLAIELGVSWLVPWTQNAFGLLLGPLITSMGLFFVPSALLGALSPLAVVLYQRQVGHLGTGRAAGSVSFWSTTGSIAGSLGTAFIVIPRVGLSSLILGIGLGLAVIGLAGILVASPWGSRRLFGMLFVPALLVSIGWGGIPNPALLYARDGQYGLVRIFDGEYAGRPARFLQIDDSRSGARFLDGDDLAYEYTRYADLLGILRPDSRRALVIGGGSYSIPQALVRQLPVARVEVAEIEPKLYDLSREYFGLKESPRLVNFVEDGRRILQHKSNYYDVIFGDAYYSRSSIPQHLATREFFELAKASLTADGIFMANIVGTLRQQTPSFTLSELKTFREVFPHCLVVAVDSPTLQQPQNLIVMGFKGGMPKLEEYRGQGAVVDQAVERLVNIDNLQLKPHAVFTDDFAPIDYYIATTVRLDS